MPSPNSRRSDAGSGRTRPGDAENHQVGNARELSDHHAAVLIEESDLTTDRVIGEVTGLMADSVELAGMSAASAALGSRHRSGKLVDLIERVAAR